MADVRRRLQQVLKAVMKEENAVAFFNDPVDAEALGIAHEYRQVVKVPMDLGKVAAQLDAGRYTDAVAVLRDVALIWRNCRAFNMPGSDVYNACNQMEGAFDKHWRKAKLEKISGGLVSESFSAEHRQAEPAAPPASQFAYQAKGKAPKSLNMPTGMQAGRKHITVAKGNLPPLDAAALRMGHPLQMCLDVVSHVMRHPNAEPFNAPVDTRAYPDYRQYVQRPMDLGTIRSRLLPGTSQGWGTITYKSVSEVLSDVSLVWCNCRLYNPPGEPIVGVSRDLESIFEQAWLATGLSLDTPGGGPQRGAQAPQLSHRHSQSISASPTIAYSPRSQSHAQLSPSAASNMMRRKPFGDRAMPDALADEPEQHRDKRQRVRKPSRKADSDPDFSLNDSDSAGAGGASQHSSDSAGSWQPRRKKSSGAPSSSSGGNAKRGKAQSRSITGQYNRDHAGSGSLLHSALSHDQFTSEASQLGSSRALMGYTQQQHDPLFAQQQAYAVARRRAELAAAAQQETEEERAVLIQHARLSQARMQAAQAQQRAEVAIREVHNARAVLMQVEASMQARAQAKDQAEQQAAELRKQEWPPGARLVTAEAAQQLTQEQTAQQQQQQPVLQPEVNALAQAWLDWDSPVLQSSMDSATTNQKPPASQPQMAT